MNGHCIFSKNSEYNFYIRIEYLYNLFGKPISVRFLSEKGLSTRSSTQRAESIFPTRRIPNVQLNVQLILHLLHNNLKVLA